MAKITVNGREFEAEEGAVEIARRSHGTPRIANRLLRRVRDYIYYSGFFHAI